MKNSSYTVIKVVKRYWNFFVDIQISTIDKIRYFNKKWCFFFLAILLKVITISMVYRQFCFKYLERDF